MTLKRSLVECDGATYTITEMPAGMLRVASRLNDPDAQLGLLGLCVLDDKLVPYENRAEDEIPLRHLEPLLNGILELSGLSEDPKADGSD